MKTIQGARRRIFIGAMGAAGLAAVVGAQAQGSAAQKPAARPWRLLVNEAVTGESNIFILTARYRPLAD